MTSVIPEGYDEDFPNRVSPVREAQNRSTGAESSSPFGSKQQLVTADIEQAVKQTFTGTLLPQHPCFFFFKSVEFVKGIPC